MEFLIVMVNNPSLLLNDDSLPLDVVDLDVLAPELGLGFFFLLLKVLNIIVQLTEFQLLMLYFLIIIDQLFVPLFFFFF